MKYLKYITESKSDLEISEEAKRDIDDYLLILKDEGYEVETKVIMDYHGILHVKILNHNNNTAKWKDFKYDLLSAISCVSDRFMPSYVYYKDVKSRSNGYKAWSNFLDYIQDEQVLSHFSIELAQIVDRKWYYGHI